MYRHRQGSQLKIIFPYFSLFRLIMEVKKKIKLHLHVDLINQYSRLNHDSRALSSNPTSLIIFAAADYFSHGIIETLFFFQLHICSGSYFQVMVSRLVQLMRCARAPSISRMSLWICFKHSLAKPRINRLTDNKCNQCTRFFMGTRPSGGDCGD